MVELKCAPEGRDKKALPRDREFVCCSRLWRESRRTKLAAISGWEGQRYGVILSPGQSIRGTLINPERPVTRVRRIAFSSECVMLPRVTV